MRIDCRAADKGRLNDVVGAIEIGIADNLRIVVILNHYRSHVLIGIVGIYVLNDNEVRTAINLFDYAEVVHIAVAVEVQIADLARIIVQVPFEFFQGACLGKSNGYCLKVKVITKVGCCIDIDGLGWRYHSVGHHGLSRLLDNHGGRLFGRNRRSDNTCL